MIQDIIEEIKKVNQMIDFHSTNKDSDFMLKQYQAKRDQLISELEEELVKLDDFDNWKEWKNSVYL
jgi:DNA-binding Lrp family transcriptional regulator